MQGYFCDWSKIYFPQLSASQENLGGLQAGFLWFLMLMSLLLLGLTADSPQTQFGSYRKAKIRQHYSRQSFRFLFFFYIFFERKTKQYLLLSHWVCSHRGGRKDEGVKFFKSDCFQVLHFSRNHKPHGILGLVDILNYLNYLSVPPYPARRIVSLWFEEFA